MNLNANERKVLRFLVENFSEDYGYYGFKGIGKNTRLSRAKVRLACRSLKRKGLTDFASGLATDDGEFRGSGYSATRSGCELIKPEEFSEDT